MRKSIMRRHSRRTYRAPCFESLERRNLLSVTILDFEDQPQATLINSQYERLGADFSRSTISTKGGLLPDKYPQGYCTIGAGAAIPCSTWSK